MFRYTAYGLHIESTLALPELIADSQTEPDVNIRCGSLGWEVPVEPGAITCLKAAVQEVYLAWGRIAALLVKDGREITIDPFPGGG